MKKMKQWKLASFALVLVLVLTGAVGLLAMAADKDQGFETSAIDVDYINETITVMVADGTTYPTLNPEDIDTIVYYTDRYTKDVTRWNACEVRERITQDENGNEIKEAVAVFDISWIDDNKDVRMYLCGNEINTKVVAVDIIWEEDFNVEFTGTLLTTDITEAETWQQIYKNYPNFSEDTGYFIFTLEENNREASYFDLDTILWRKGSDGVWRLFNELDLKEMNIRGIKLEFRVQASNSKEVESSGADGTTTKDVVAGARASSTAKIAVAKLSDGPEPMVNADLMSVGIRNGMEFSFDKKTWFMVPDYDRKFGTEQYVVTLEEREKAIEQIYTDVKVVNLLMQEVIKEVVPAFTMNSSMSKEDLEASYSDVFKFTDEGIELYVREAATRRRAATKVTKVYIPYAAKGMAQAAEDDIVMSYGESKTGNGGLLLENTSEYKYQVAVLTAEQYNAALDPNDIDITDLKWTAIKPGKVLKLTNKKVPNGSYIVYRIAGEDGYLPSTYIISDKIDFNTLTYAGIASNKKYVGDVLEAVVSTNVKIEDMKFQWQSCEDVAVAEPVWTDIAGATSSTYTIADGDVNKYIRVVITDKAGTVLASEEVGPMKAK